MKRRDFIACAGAAGLLPAALQAAPIPYTPGLVRERLAAGETVFLDFKATWCTTCKAQERVMTRLKEANPEYEANIAFVVVDWDTYGKSNFATGLKIPRRSTLVVLKGNEEIGRLVAETREDKIKELMDAALSAATA